MGVQSLPTSRFVEGNSADQAAVLPLPGGKISDTIKAHL
jgi:hypothetical protein